MADQKRFKSPVPKGYRIAVNEFPIAGASRYSVGIEGMMGKRELELYLQAEPDNKHDANAIQVWCHGRGWFLRRLEMFGHLPRELAAVVAESGLVDELVPRLKRIWVGDRGGAVVEIDLLIPKTLYERLQQAGRDLADRERQALLARPATPIQKEMYRFFGEKPPAKVTRGDFEQWRAELRTRQDVPEKKRQMWAHFQSVFEDINDPENRREYEIKAVSLKAYKGIIKDMLDEGVVESLMDIDVDEVAMHIEDERPELLR